MPTTIHAGCKINLYLFITGVRDDGYHELDTLFFPLPSPCDTLTIDKGDPGTGLSLTCSDPKLAGESNLVAKAYRAFVQASGFAPDLAVHLDKKSPIGAGLGGGSGDCAAMLKHLNAMADEQALEDSTLAALAAKLGADVPFFLLNTPARATGIGDVLTPVDVDMTGLSLVLLTPQVHISTPWAYKAFDDLGEPTGRPENFLGQKFLTGPGETVSDPIRPAGMGLANDFERVVFPAHPELAGLKEELLSAGAIEAVLSGSGASLFGLFPDRTNAEGVVKELSGWNIPAHAFHF